MKSKCSTRKVRKHSKLVATVWLLGTICVIGCNPTIPKGRELAEVRDESANGAGPRESALVIDLGYIDLGSNVTFGMPLSRLGLPPDAKIESVESSCECVQGEAAEYRGPEASTTVRVVKIKIWEDAEVFRDEKQESVVPLSVVLSIRCLDGLSRSVIVRFVWSEVLL